MVRGEKKVMLFLGNATVHPPSLIDMYSNITLYYFLQEIGKGVDILQAITWVAGAWKEVSVSTIKNCFANCGIITERQSGSEEGISDEKFDVLFKELTADSECDMTAEECIDFDVQTCSSLLAINVDMVDWRVSSVQNCIAEYLRKESREDPVKVVSDSADEDDVGEECDEVNVSREEALSMIDKLFNLKDLNKEERNSLASLKKFRNNQNKQQNAEID